METISIVTISICITFLLTLFIIRYKSCKHDYELIGTEHTNYGIVKYKVFTSKCKKCGDVKIKKMQIN